MRSPSQNLLCHTRSESMDPLQRRLLIFHPYRGRIQAAGYNYNIHDRHTVYHAISLLKSQCAHKYGGYFVREWKAAAAFKGFFLSEDLSLTQLCRILRFFSSLTNRFKISSRQNSRLGNMDNTMRVPPLEKKKSFPSGLAVFASRSKSIIAFFIDIF